MPSEAREDYYEVYIAGALTGLSPEEAEEHKRMYQGAAQVCQELGLRAYLPHEHTDPVNHPLVSPHEVYQTDTSRVRDARLVIAFTDVPSHGVGVELEVAAQSRKHVILMIRLGTPVSRMVLGNPAVIGAVPYPDWEKGARLLRLMLVNRVELLDISPAVPSREQESMGWMDIYLPATYNDGQPVPEEEFEAFQDFISRRFGGWSFNLGKGGWLNEQGREYCESHRCYRILVAARDFGEDECKRLKEALQKRFKQIEILITWTPARRL